VLVGDRQLREVDLVLDLIDQVERGLELRLDVSYEFIPRCIIAIVREEWSWFLSHEYHRAGVVNYLLNFCCTFLGLFYKEEVRLGLLEL
jgi:hypothetical protein